MKTPSKKKSILVLVCGGSAAGKTTVCNKIRDNLPKDKKLSVVCLDNFYKHSLTKVKQNKTHTNINFDHPDSFDWDLIVKSVKQLLEGKKVKVPMYDYNNSTYFKDKFVEIKPADVIIAEGIFALNSKELNDLADLKIYVYANDEERFARRLNRDKKERGRTDLDVSAQWNKVVQPMFIEHVDPQKRHAHLVIPWHSHNEVAIIALKAAMLDILKKYKK